MAPLVSAVIPVNNGQSFVADAIQSVLNQTYHNLECIVVDDGSTDNTLKVLRGFGNSIRIIHQTNQGVSSARNRGITEAKGELIAFLDADDVWLPRKTERQARLFEADPQLALAYSGAFVVDVDLHHRGRLDPAPSDLALKNTLLLEKPFMSAIGSTSMIRRSVLEKLNGFDEALSTSADCDLACRIALRWRVAPYPAPLALYRCGPSQMHNNLETTEQEMEWIFERFFGEQGANRLPSSWRRRARANLHLSLAGAYMMRGDRQRFIHHGLRALRRPDRVLNALRRLTRPADGPNRMP